MYSNDQIVYDTKHVLTFAELLFTSISSFAIKVSPIYKALASSLRICNKRVKVICLRLELSHFYDLADCRVAVSVIFLWLPLTSNVVKEGLLWCLNI